MDVFSCIFRGFSEVCTVCFYWAVLVKFCIGIDFDNMVMIGFVVAALAANPILQMICLGLKVINWIKMRRLKRKTENMGADASVGNMWLKRNNTKINNTTIG